MRKTRDKHDSSRQELTVGLVRRIRHTHLTPGGQRISWDKPDPGLGEPEEKNLFRNTIQAGSLPLPSVGHRIHLATVAMSMCSAHGLRAPSQPAATKSSTSARAVVGRRIILGIQPLVFMSSGYTALPSSVAPFYDSHSWG